MASGDDWMEMHLSMAKIEIIAKYTIEYDDEKIKSSFISLDFPIKLLYRTSTLFNVYDSLPSNIGKVISWEEIARKKL